MSLSWNEIKDVFFAVGSLAGVAAFFRPVIESKFQRDIERAQRIQSLLDEQRVVELGSWLYLHRSVRESDLDPFDQLRHEVRNNQDHIRFSGPLRKYLNQELSRILKAYKDLREFVQVPEWEPAKHDYEDGSFEWRWDFNKRAFFDDVVGTPRDYAKHLADVADCAERIKVAYQRLQIVSEMHVLESPLAWFLLPRRFKAHGVQT